MEFSYSELAAIKGILEYFWITDCSSPMLREQAQQITDRIRDEAGITTDAVWLKKVIDGNR